MANKKAKGKRAKSRHKLKSKGRVTPNEVVEEIDDATNVTVNANGSYHSTIPFRRFVGKAGKVIGKQGDVYRVELKDGNKKKEIIVSSVHLKLVKEGN